MNYLPITETDRQEMLKVIGVNNAAELYAVVPLKAQVKGLNLPAGMSEQKLTRTFETIAKKNSSLSDLLSFRGAGVYEHFIPSIVDELANRSEFTTAYTPYQAEASQGTLQAIFEYQSLITKLTGLEVSNASLYDGATAVAEAALLALRSTGRTKLLVSKALHPEYRKVLATYLQGINAQIVEMPLANGVTLVPAADDTIAAVIIQTPNFFGSVENISQAKDALGTSSALLICVANPLSLGILRSPGAEGADICVGEGQVLGNATGLGGFGFGFIAARKALSWKMPGRIVGQTTDTLGRRGFVLTLTSREQHIRREKATSNICTNASLNALTGCIYLAGLGPKGIEEVAMANLQNSHYAFERITKLAGFAPAFKNQPFFNEFTVTTDRNIEQLQQNLLSNKIMGPLELGGFFTEAKNQLLFCVTETKTKADIDKLVDALAQAGK
jgi:glycine dehydrogenase subunit 1